jgi:hypothetical protein
MKLQSLAIATCALLFLPVLASAQGIIGGAQEGASKGAREGNRAAPLLAAPQVLSPAA